MKSKFLIMALLVFAFTACKKEKDECTNCNTPALSEKDIAINDYKTNYLGSEITDCGWTGDKFSCIAGTVPQSTHDKVLKRINYFRRMAGLNDNTTFDESKFAKYQETALMMKANGTVNHFPPNTWSCWTQIGSDGAATSNLFIGYHSSDAVTGFMEDGGSGNTAAGHRRWILHSQKTQFSYGTTDESMSLGVIGVAGGNTKIPEFIAWPPKGFIPQQLVFPRWSFGLPNANFSNANITMTGPKGNIVLTVVSRTDNGYGDNTIVWEPQGIILGSNADVQYTVNVTGIINATSSSFSYNVTIINPN